MKTARLSEVDARDADPEHFTGSVTRHDLIAVDEPPSSAIVVRFSPGARTHWHRHPDGQYLYALEGDGLAQARGGDVLRLLPGDCVYAAPGEEHWHGASSEIAFAHLAFSFGVTDWVGPADVD